MMLNAFASIKCSKNASIMYKCLIVSAFSSPSLCLALRSDGCDVKKQAQIGAVKDTSTSMSYSFSQPLFLQNLKYVCVIQRSFICKRKNKTFLSVLNFLHHIPQVFSPRAGQCKYASENAFQVSIVN